MIERYPETRKRVYIVRHGSTSGNEANTYQFGDTALSERGLTQAKFVGARLAKLPVDIILASTMTRATQTALAIAETIGKEVVLVDQLHEFLRPSVMQGRRKDDADIMELTRAVDHAFATSGERYSDEESFFDVQKRAQEALGIILDRPEEHICVVTHGAFLKMLIATMIYGDELTPPAFARFFHFVHPSNTGISVMDYAPDLAPMYPHERASSWKCMTLNDHAHLG